MILMHETLLPYRAALHRPVVEAADGGDTDNSEFRDAAHCRAALHRSVASPAKEAADAGDTKDHEFGDAAYCRAALHMT